MRFIVQCVLELWDTSSLTCSEEIRECSVATCVRGGQTPVTEGITTTHRARKSEQAYLRDGSSRQSSVPSSPARLAYSEKMRVEGEVTNYCPTFSVRVRGVQVIQLGEAA